MSKRCIHTAITKTSTRTTIERCPFQAVNRKKYCIKHNEFNELIEEYKRRYGI